MHERSSVVAGALRIGLVAKMTDLPSLLDVKGKPEAGSPTSNFTRWLVRGAAGLALVAAAS
jgi:two-component system, NtrC family, C4-dicarboxylate transport sensor histidine kinase DctB